MSDIQEPLIVLQHRMQKRQILAMMGINQWVQPDSTTINSVDISSIAQDQASLSHQSVSKEQVEQPSRVASSIEHSNDESLDNESAGSISSSVNRPTNNYDDIYNGNEAQNLDLQNNQQGPVTYSFDSTAPQVSKPVTSLVNTVVQQTAIDNVNNAASLEDGSFKNGGFKDKGFREESFKKESFKKVAPFDLQGGRYGDWVILVDIKALNHDSQKLWQNITQALSISCETTSFPICEGMDTAELANASLAGYVFKIGRREEIKVAALTVLPDGLEHPNFTTVPTLDEMLKDSKLKRQLWEQLSKQN